MSITLCNNNTLPVKISLTSAVEAAQAVATEAARATAAEASLQTEMRNGRVYTMAGNSPSGQTIPVDYSIDLLAMQQRSTNTMTYWRYLNTAPDPAVETETVKLDAGGTWWKLVADPAIAAESDRAISAENALGELLRARLYTIDGAVRGEAVSVYGAYGGSANNITVTTGLLGISVGTEVRFRATAANTGSATLNVDGSGARPCRTITGAALPGGYIRTDADTVATYDGTYWVLDRKEQYGSNANGIFFRAASGRQHCIINSTDAVSSWTQLESGQYATYETIDKVFPSSFVSRPAISGNCSDSAFLTTGFYQNSNSRFSYRVLSPTSRSSTSVTVNIEASGRWY